MQAPVIQQRARAELRLSPGQRRWHAGTLNLKAYQSPVCPRPGTRTRSTGTLLKGPISLLFYVRASSDHATMPIMLKDASDRG